MTGTRVLLVDDHPVVREGLRSVLASAQGVEVVGREQLVHGVQAAARGETVLTPDVVGRLARAVRTPPPRLTAREDDVLRAVARGLSNPAAARELGIAEATVKSHLIRLFEKLGVDDRTSAVTTAVRLGLLELPDV